MNRTNTTVVTLVTLLTICSSLHAQSTLYWTDQTSNRIQQLTVGDTQIETIVEGPLAEPGNMFFDIVGQHLYWSNTGRNEIVRMNPEGSGLTVVQRGHLVTIDTEARKMYVLVDTTLYRTNLDGSEPTQLMGLADLYGDGALNSPAAIDLRNGIVYWSFWDKTGDATSSGVRRANLDGSDQELLMDNQGKGIAFIGLAIDTVGNQLYMYDAWGPHNFSSVNLDGSDYKYEDHHRYVRGFSVHPVTQKIYWVAGTESARVYRSNLDGTEVEGQAGFLGKPTGMALDPVRNRVYFGTNFGIWRSEIDGPYLVGVQPIFTTNLANLHGLHLDEDAGRLYWTNGVAIGRHDLDGLNQQIIVEGPGERIEDLVVDPQRGFIYWSQTWNSGASASSVLRTRLDGSEMQSPVTIQESNGGPLALDVEGNRLFWAAKDGIYVADADGSNRGQIYKHEVVSSGPSINGLALDTENGRVYYTRWTGRSHTWGWANIDGSGSVPGLSLATDYLTGALAVDPRENYLYWAEIRYEQGHRFGSIWRKSLADASAAEPVVNGLGSVSSLVLDPQGAATAVETRPVPSPSTMSQSFPNPFREATTIQYHLDAAERVKIKVCDALGRVVAQLVDDVQTAGGHKVIWTADDHTPSGTYFYTLETSEGAVTRSMTLLK